MLTTLRTRNIQEGLNQRGKAPTQSSDAREAASIPQFLSFPPTSRAALVEGIIQQTLKLQGDNSKEIARRLEGRGKLQSQPS